MLHRKSLLPLLALLAVAQFEPMLAQPKVASVRLLPSLSALQPGSSVKLAAVVTIQEGWHINTNKPTEDFLVPTELEFGSTDGVEFGEVEYPPGRKIKFAFWPKPLDVYEGRVVFYVDVRLRESSAGDSVRVNGVLRYQACNDNSCAPPDELPVSLVIPVVSLSTPVHPVNDSLFVATSLGTVSGAKPEGELAAVISEKGLLVAFLLIFLGGLALNLTPCVYPLIPITVSYFGAQQSRSAAEAFSKSLAYVLGIAVMYSVLGVVAALTGGLFGASLQNPWVLGFVALVFVALALSMFGLYEFRIPGWLAGAASTTKGGYFGAFFMGLTVGIVAAPCIGPFILALLAYVAATGNPFLGFWMFFVLALGLGLPYLILGTFSSAISRLPQSGAWMVWVKKIFGFILIGMAVYFLRPLIPVGVYRFLLPLVALVAGVYLGWVEKSESPGRGFAVTRWVVGLAGIFLALWLVRPIEARQGLEWQPYTPEALEAAVSEGKPVIVDVSAEWCVACKELDHETFTDPEVVARASQFVTLRADLTRYGSPEAKELRSRYKIMGLPTVLFLRPDGSEIEDLRVLGFIPGEEFARRMDRALREVESR